VELVDVEDTNWKADAAGGPGEQVQVTLQLRVVADAGIVGLPNVGKSTLLRAMTSSTAEVANYPFTTLMPNLGVLSSDQFSPAATKRVLVDLPGLIEGAHTGKGLGRMFLRHLARTQVLVHVVDAAAQDPATDFWVVREELRMFNPAYCQRPHIVVLNKMDLPDANELKVRGCCSAAAALHQHHHLAPETSATRAGGAAS
jgi:GTPase